MRAASIVLPDSADRLDPTLPSQLLQDVKKSDAVGVTCWDGGHNPIGRAKVLYDVLDGRRPVWLFCYLFDEFGGKLWEPLKDAGLRIFTIPWKERELYHRLFAIYGIQFPTVWMCKPRLPTLMLTSAIARSNAKLVLDFDDNEEHFSKSQGSVGKPYGGETIGLVRSVTEGIAARTAASLSLSEDYQAEIVRHARKQSSLKSDRTAANRSRVLRVGFVGTVRPHKRLLEAAQAIRVAGHISGYELEFCVYGDIKPIDYRKQLELNCVKTHGMVLAGDLEATLQSFDLVLTGYPSNSPADEPITQYQITSKIGDALANGIPALVPRSRSVEDLEEVPGVFLFDSDDFSDVLIKAIEYNERIELPVHFSTDGAYLDFKKVEKKAIKDSSVLDIFRTAQLPNNNERSVLLLWKQQDGGLYGRRVDQIARTIKLLDPEVTVRIVEFMNDSDHASLKDKANEFPSDAADILQLSELKQAGALKTSEGVIYNQLRVKTDTDAAAALINFLWINGHTPENSLIVTFPAFPLLAQLASVLDPFPLIADIVDNQLSWGNNKTKADYISQYVWLMRKSRRIIFNSYANKKYFETSGFIEPQLEKKVSVVPNWYIPPKSAASSLDAPLVPFERYVHVIYSGNLNDRIDWDLLERCASLSPYLRLHIVGDGSRVMSKLRALIGMDSIIYHGPLSEMRVSQLLRKMHFAIMPHLKDEVSSFMNPLKVMMYAAHRLRSIALEVPGLNDIDGLCIVETPEAFLEEVQVWAKNVKEGVFTPLAPKDDAPTFSSIYMDLIKSELPPLDL